MSISNTVIKVVLTVSMSMFLVNCGGGGSDDVNPVIDPVNITPLIPGAEESDTPETNENSNKSTETDKKETLGKSLFFDTNLSLNRTMSCASCHNPEHAFIDTRDNGVYGAVSLGDDNVSLGDRNAPTIGYANFTPTFDIANLIGGQFLDGSAFDLTEQAKGPFLNPVEMQMPDKRSVVERVRENTNYIVLMEDIYGATVFNDTDTAFNAIADAISAFENTDVFAPFDSAFDTGTLTKQQKRGASLFLEHKCGTCHDMGSFTNFEYHNIGLPENTLVRALNGHAPDHGLLGHPDISDTNHDGKFKVPTLRNIAVTGPYMHNGIFKDLKTVIHFYNTRDVIDAINPETGGKWANAEIPQNIMEEDDMGNLGLTDTEEDDIVAFLKALTDSKYTSLIP